MSLASDLWNGLPNEQRKRLHGILMQDQIRDLNIELGRLERAYKRARKEVLEHRKNVERSFQEWEKQQEPSNEG